VVLLAIGALLGVRAKEVIESNHSSWDWVLEVRHIGSRDFYPFASRPSLETIRSTVAAAMERFESVDNDAVGLTFPRLSVTRRYFGSDGSGSTDSIGEFALREVASQDSPEERFEVVHDDALDDLLIESEPKPFESAVRALAEVMEKQVAEYFRDAETEEEILRTINALRSDG